MSGDTALTDGKTVYTCETDVKRGHFELQLGPGWYRQDLVIVNGQTIPVQQANTEELVDRFREFLRRAA